MASLIENLITGLNEEYVVYEELLTLSRNKTTVIVANNLDELRDISDKEQEIVDIITGYEFKRKELMKNIGTVLNKNYDELTILDIADFLSTQPNFRIPLLEINEKLKNIASLLKEVNNHNKVLIEESLEMIGFNINLLQNLNRAPENANYSKEMFKKHPSYGAGGDVSSFNAFDLKQ